MQATRIVGEALKASATQTSQLCHIPALPNRGVATRQLSMIAEAYEAA